MAASTSPPSTGTRVCPQCSRTVERDWLVCPACLSKLPAAAHELATETLFANAPTGSSTSADEGRFPAGTVLAGRYRVLGMLGQGGMGEVYKAFDLILNQTVALKFLAKQKFNEAALARFRNEVRIARQVSHPNVCRVYDIGFVDGLHFLSMEYLDGEDLGSLLRRIGRLPADKATEFTRKICAGLSAAHDRGVLHRDLKPGNIMIDGRGQVRITDFGLAALAEEIALGDIRSGTPAYMSPEQKSGREVTVRSDIYSLGLVIHEMFTGKRRDASSSSPSEIVKDLDPAVERLILRCLEDDPRKRPSSALNVAMALPGADPIAAALAAGETPSPEMVAASQEKEGMSPRAAIACLSVAILGTIVMLVWGFPDMLARHASLDLQPEALAHEARSMLRQFGFPDKPADSAYGFSSSYEKYRSDSIEKLPPAERNAVFASHQPAFMQFWYRQHEGPLDAVPALGRPGVDWRSPANDVPGMIRMTLDPAAKLVYLEARPPERETDVSPFAEPISVEKLFVLAGLDLTRFTPRAPELVPPMNSDSRFTYTGTFAPNRTDEVRVEGAFWRGRLVFFTVTGEWEISPFGADSSGADRSVIAIILIVGGGILAWRNTRLGRTDHRGAFLSAAVNFWVLLIANLFQIHYLPALSSVGSVVEALSIALFAFAVIWVVYLGIEPFVRRNFPDALIAIKRLQNGKLRDPLVASNVLGGLLALGTMHLLSPTQRISSPWTGLESLPVFFGSTLYLASSALIVVSLFCLLVVLLRLALLPLVRGRLWIADFVVVLPVPLWTLYNSPGLAGMLSAAGGLVAYSLLLWTVRRFGLLAAVTFVLSTVVVATVPPVLSSWWSGRVLIAYGLPILAGAWALWVILTDKRTHTTQTAG